MKTQYLYKQEATAKIQEYFDEELSKYFSGKLELKNTQRVSKGCVAGHFESDHKFDYQQAVVVLLYDTIIYSRIVNEQGVHSEEMYDGGFNTQTTKRNINKFCSGYLVQKNYNWIYVLDEKEYNFNLLQSHKEYCETILGYFPFKE